MSYNEEFSIHIIKIDDQDIRVAIRPGEGNSIPLLIFNGIGASLELVIPFARGVSSDTEIIIFDVPGAGGSPSPTLPYRFSGLASLSTRILDYFGYGNVNVLGVSWGGALAQQFAHDYPERCKKLILAATSMGVVMVPGGLKVLFKMASPRRYIQPSYKKSIAGEIYGGAFRDNPGLVEDMLSKADLFKSDVSKLGYYYQLATGFGWTSAYWLHKLKQPTLILAGNDDPIIPLINMKVMSWLIPNSKLHIIEDGHLFLLTSGDIVSPIINEFLMEG